MPTDAASPLAHEAHRLAERAMGICMEAEDQLHAVVEALHAAKDHAPHDRVLHDLYDRLSLASTRMTDAGVRANEATEALAEAERLARSTPYDPEPGQRWVCDVCATPVEPLLANDHRGEQGVRLDCPCYRPLRPTLRRQQC